MCVCGHARACVRTRANVHAQFVCARVCARLGARASYTTHSSAQHIQVHLVVGIHRLPTERSTSVSSSLLKADIGLFCG